MSGPHPSISANLNRNPDTVDVCRHFPSFPPHLSPLTALKAGKSGTTPFSEQISHINSPNLALYTFEDALSHFIFPGANKGNKQLHF